MGLATEQVKQVLENLADHRQDLILKIDKDNTLIVALQTEIGELEDIMEEASARLKKGQRLKQKYDQNIQQTQEAMDNIDNTARRFATTFAGLGKLKKEQR